MTLYLSNSDGDYAFLYDFVNSISCCVVTESVVGSMEVCCDVMKGLTSDPCDDSHCQTHCHQMTSPAPAPVSLYLS